MAEGKKSAARIAAEHLPEPERDAVLDELSRLRVQAQARDLLAAERAGTSPPFDAGLLNDVLARPPEPPYRIEDVLPSDAGLLVVAQRKTGKTTLELNLARSLITGEKFLGRFAVRPVKDRVAILNYEVSAGQLARWAKEAGVPKDRLYLVNLRGWRNPLHHPEDRKRLAELLIENKVESVIVDPFGRAYGGQSQNDNGEVMAWLVELDRWARAEVGAADVILTAHAGWEGERTRGASALEDWADSIITMTRGKRGDEHSRYLRAEGRDVLVEQDLLGFDPDTRTLELTGIGSRQETAKDRHVEQLVPMVVQIVTETPGVSGNKIEQALRTRGETFQKGDGNKAATMAVDQVLIKKVEDGPRHAKTYLPLPTSPTSPSTPLGEVHPPPPAPYRGEVDCGEVVPTATPGRSPHARRTKAGDRRTLRIPRKGKTVRKGDVDGAA